MRPGGRGRRGEYAVDRAVLARLRSDLGVDVVESFVQSYLDLLSGRLAELELAIHRREAAEAARVMIDLRSSSLMLGARPLAALVTEMEESLRRNQNRNADAEALLTRMRREAAKVAAELRSSVGGDGMGDQLPNL